MEDCELELDEMDCCELIQELKTRWADLIERSRITDQMLEGRDVLVNESNLDAVDTIVYRLINLN